MKCKFNTCTEAVLYAEETKTFGFNYSDKQTPDQNIHIHNSCEVLLCLSGGETFLINDRVYNVEDGDLFVINQFEAHKINSSSEKKFKRYIMQVHPEFLYSHSTAETNLSSCFYTRGAGAFNKINLTREEQNELIGYLDKLDEDAPFGDDIKKTNLALDVLILINAAFSSHASVGNQTGVNAIKTAIDYINDNFAESLSLEKIAKNSYVSVNQLCRLFNKYCGTTVVKYITSRRITEAKKMLASGKNVTDTAILCGFEDYANFIRVFKKCVGVTPGKYTATL